MTSMTSSENLNLPEAVNPSGEESLFSRVISRLGTMLGRCCEALGQDVVVIEEEDGKCGVIGACGGIRLRTANPGR